jgi:ABC-type antimicrobial peptide transport system permease subunit
VTGTLESIFDSVFSIPGIVIAWIIAAVITHTF